MATIAQIIDAVKSLTPEERERLFNRLRLLGLEPKGAPPPNAAYYASDEFTTELSDLFHRGKRQALGSE